MPHKTGHTWKQLGTDIKNKVKTSVNTAAKNVAKATESKGNGKGKKKKTLRQKLEPVLKGAQKIGDSGILGQLAEMSEGSPTGDAGEVKDEKPSPFFDTNKDYERASAAIDKLYPK